MPRVPTHRAIATKASIATLFAMAEADGECRILVESEHACTVIRRKCYAYRAQLRKGNVGLTGMETSSYDAFTFPFRYVDNLGKYEFTITSNETVEFELLIPEETAFDISKFEFIQDSDLPQVSLEHHEDEFAQSANAYMDSLDDQIPF